MIAFLENKQFDSKPQITIMFESPTSKEIRICMAKGNVSITSLEDTTLLKAGDMLCFERVMRFFNNLYLCQKYIARS